MIFIRGRGAAQRRIRADRCSRASACLPGRGMEPEKWHPSTDFTVTSEGGTVFETVDLSEGDWTEYCEKSAAPVSIMDIDHKFEAV